MKKTNWNRVRSIIVHVSFVVFIFFFVYSIVLFLIYMHDGYELALKFAWGGLAIAIASIVIGYVACIFDFICNYKKQKKLKYVKQQITIEENIVV